MDKIVGLVEVTGSCFWTVQCDNYGGNKFEKREYFQNAKGQCYPGDFDEATAAIQDMCEAVVRRSVTRAIAEIRNGGEPIIQQREPAPKASAKIVEIPAPAPAPQAEATTPPTATPPTGKAYQVGEKPAPAATTPPPACVTPATGKPPAEKKPQTVIAERLQAAGVTQAELSKVVRVAFGVLPEGQRYAQKQYVDAFTEAEKVIAEIGLEKFRAGLANATEKATPAPEAMPTAAPTASTAPAGESVVFSTDAAVVEARKQVTAKWPMWSVELVNVASLWCADQVKDVGQLDAFLISAEVTQTTPPGRIEALLAITRHLSIGSLVNLIDYLKKTKKPVSMVEEELGAAVGKSIRFALDLPGDAVAMALGKMMDAAKEAKK